MGSIVLHGIGFFISKEETRGNLRIAANWMLWSGAAATDVHWKKWTRDSPKWRIEAWEEDALV